MKSTSPTANKSDGTPAMFNRHCAIRIRAWQGTFVGHRIEFGRCEQIVERIASGDADPALPGDRMILTTSGMTRPEPHYSA